MKDLTKLLPYIIGGVAVYLLWKKLDGLGSKAGDMIGQKIVDAFGLDQTDVTLQAKILMPSGSLVDANSVHVDETMKFVLSGKTYKLTGRNAQNYYVAVAV